MKKLLKNKNLSSIIFISILSLISFVFLFKILLNNNEINNVDRRYAYHLKFPTYKEFIKGDYQNGIDEEIADQMPFYEFFKIAYNRLTNYINFKHIELFNLDNGKDYVTLEKANLYNGYAVYTPIGSHYVPEYLKNDIDFLNEDLSKVKVNAYLYFVQTDMDYNFTNDEVSSIKDFIFYYANIKEENKSAFIFTTFDEYKDYFYKADHHWNYKGSYKGYQEIAKLMKFSKTLSPKEEICYTDIPSVGHKNIYFGDLEFIQEVMCRYEFDYPEFDIIANGSKIENLGYTDEELRKLESISYGDLWGDNYGEIIVKNKGKNNGKKLLVYGTSFSNPIKLLLASEYETTYIIDGRYYKDKHLDEYINERKIDDVLVICSTMMFGEELYW